MAVKVNVDGQIVNVTDTDDPKLAKKIARRELKKRSGDYSALGETFIKGPIYGLQTGLIQGPVELASTLVDLAADTDYTSDINEFFEKHKVEKPISAAGNVSSALFQFGAPASIATKLARKSLLKPKPGKLFDQSGKYIQKPKLFKHTIAPIATADFIAATSDTPELGLFDALDPEFFAPTNPEEEIKGLDEKITAADRIGKRLRVGAEGATLLLGLPYLWRGLKAAGSGVASELSQTKSVVSAADWVKNKKDYIRGMLDEGQFKNKKIKILGKEYDQYDIISKFRSRGALPTEDVANVKAAKTAAMNQQVTVLESSLDNIWGGFKYLDKNNKMSGDDLTSLADNIRTALYGESKKAQQNALNTLKQVDNQFLKDQKFSFFDTANLTRNQIDDLSRLLIQEDNLKYLPKGFADAVDANLGKYGYTAYRAFIKNVDHVVKMNSPQWKNARKELLDNNIAKTPEKADQMLKDLLEKRNFDSSYMVPDMALGGVKVGLLKGKQLNSLPKVREFLGEVTGKTGTAAERVSETMMKTRATLENLAKQTSELDYLRNVSMINNRLAQTGSTQRFLYDSIDEIPDAQKAAFLDDYGDAVRIPDQAKYGDVAGKITTKRIADAITDVQTGLLERYSGGITKTWATFLGFKGAIQKAKTIYSPITQVRNATSASLFAVLNGNLANGKTLEDSMLVVLESLKRTQGNNMANYYANAQKRNVVQSGARIGEIDSLLDDAVKTIGMKEKSFLSDAYKREKNNFATRLYVGSDDLWKIASWEMEKGRLARAFNNAAKKNASFTITPNLYKGLSPKSIRELERKKCVWSQFDDKLKKEIIEDIGADVVRNTVPNYSKVPPIISMLRRTPFGNFIAFPAETIRTSLMSTSRAIDELASGVPELADIGMRRLMGNMAVMYGIPKATYEFGKYITGADDEQVQAYKRSFAAPWEKNADLIPIRTDKDGNIVEFYNYTYTNPYEYLRAPLNAVFNAVQNGETRGDKLHEILMQGIKGTADNPGMLREFLEPFVGPSIATNIASDIFSNVTYSSGSARPIWNSTDNAGLAWQKGIAHVVNTAFPPFVPAKWKPGETGDWGPLFLKDLPRATVASLGFSDKDINKKGVRPNIYGQIAESFTGLKTIKPTIKRTLGFRALDAKDQMRQAVSYYSAAASNPNILNPEEHVRALMKTNEAQFNAIKDLSMAIEDSKALGADENEIYKILKEKKISNPEMIMNRTFIPYYPSAYQIEKVLAKGGEFPEKELRQSFIEEIRPTLPELPTVGFDRQPFVPPRDPRRLTTRQKAAQDPKSSAAVLLRQKEIEKLMGIE